MTLFHAFNPLYSLAGFIVGLLIGQTGMGGGALMTPTLVLLFGIPPAVAVGTDLLYASATKTVGTLVHGANHTVDWRIVGRLALGSIPATLVTLRVIAACDLAAPGTARIIGTVLGSMLFLTAGSLLFRRRLVSLVGERLERRSPRRVAALTVLTGVALGVLVTISSVGAGAIGMTALLLLYPRQPTARLVGSDIAHAVPLTLLGGLGHLWLGSVDWAILASLLAGSVPGIVLGSYLALRVPEFVLRPVLAIMLMLVGLRLVL